MCSGFIPGDAVTRGAARGSYFAVCLVGLLVLPSSARGLDSGLREFLIIAHRGASGHAPEDTLAAFAKALAVGANVIEVDIRQSKDGHLRPDGSGWNRNVLSKLLRRVVESMQAASQ